MPIIFISLSETYTEKIKQYEQPKYYQNTEFFPIKPEEIINC